MPGAITVVTSEAQAARIRALAGALEVEVVATIDQAGEHARVVVVGEPGGAAEADPRVRYVARDSLGDAELGPLLVAIATGSSVAPDPAASTPQNAREARRAQQAFAVSRKLAGAADLAGTESIALEAIAELIDVDRAHCVFHDHDDGALWSEARLRGPGDDRRAVAGLVGWAAHTGLAAAARVASDDPRYTTAVDDPGGNPSSQILVEPIVGANRHVHAVLVAVRSARRARFSDGDAAMLARFAALAAPLLDALSSHVESQAILDEAEGDGLFRREAIAAAGPQRWGDVVRVSPAWLSWAYWLLVALLVATGVFVTFGTVSTYSTGPAIVRSTARNAVTMHTTGNVVRVEVSPGERVRAGVVIARLDDIDQRATVDRTAAEFDTQLRNHMLDPGDTAADAALRTLRLQLEQARTALDTRLIRASTAGTVSDLRVHPGQHVEPGDVAASIVEGSGGLEVVALLPGEDRPQLAPGMTLRLELAGYRYAYQTLVIDSVSADVIAPAEARRVLGPEVADGVHVAGSVVLVRGRLASNEFEADERTYSYHDGMLGTAEVRVRAERIVYALVPGLRRFDSP